MQILVDTNVILDWIMKREPFVTIATKIMKQCIDGKITGYLASHTLPDLFYILRKKFSVEQRKELVLLLCDRFFIIPEDNKIMVSAAKNELWNDFEDGLQMQCALDKNLDYIITQNIKDFATSEVKAVLPEAFIKILETA